ncbi:Signal transduction histidine kinase [Hymenobacter daecheongensis DSM 21074]|uniref:histidine kinase n=1 Tax=Hymenobacter daecheongensis DSM 21074 TaxID=1121955 RepID=A0A1M6GQV0_9BACT|nr:ATP-binding protein [Hymenobacter daecheongensis]SHJ12339.1 Signal transduction histidine kinase [Hymenobacter daecheongensis DSM 21074]
MKLQQKLILLSVLSKALMAAVLLLALPWVAQGLVLRHTDAALRAELRQVQRRIGQVGIEEFLDRPSRQGRTHYDLLQDEFIALQPSAALVADTIGTFPRRQQGQLVDFRVLRHGGFYQGRPYIYEIGKSIASLEEVYELLRTLAAYVLAFAVLPTLLFELGVIRHLLRPVDYIVERLRAVRGPVPPALPPLRTTTSDFQYLDASIQQMLLKIQSVFEQERQFIANASHELLTPISVLQNRFENMLRAEILPEEAEAQLVASQKTLHRLTATLRTLLLISRVENHQFALAERVPVAEVLAEVVEELEDRIGEMLLRVEWQLAGEPVLAPANRPLVFTLFSNLLSNAVKYNELGGLIALHGQPLPDGAYELRIRNTGKPIAPEHLAHVFERFRRFDTDAAEGYGLGLTVVHSIAQLHGIGFGISSEAGRGTEFSLRLPAPA